MGRELCVGTAGPVSLICCDCGEPLQLFSHEEHEVRGRKSNFGGETMTEQSRLHNFSLEGDEVALPKGAWAQSHRLNVRWRGKDLTALSQGAFRAYLFPVYTPAGFAVTSESPLDHPHHNSLWIGADHVNCYLPFASGAFEEANYNFYVNDIFQGRAPGRILGVGVEAEEMADGPSAAGADAALAGSDRVGRAGAAHAGGGDQDDRHPARRSGQPVRRPFAAAGGGVGSAHRADAACLFWAALDGGAAGDERGDDGRCRGGRGGRRDQWRGFGLGGLFGHGCGGQGGRAGRCFRIRARRGFPGLWQIGGR